MDPNRIGKVKVVDILASMLLDEILEVGWVGVTQFTKQGVVI